MPKAPKIYPIHLNTGWSKKLVEQHASNEFYQATRFHSDHAEYNYGAEIRENGDVELVVTYRSDDGFCFTSGPCLLKLVRPFSEERLLELKKNRMFALAEEEYFRREREKEIKAIEKVRKELFGE